MPDYSNWLTKQQAADAIGVSTKTVEKLADAKQLQQGTLRRTGKPAIVVYHPDDVDRVRKERNPDAEPFVLPPQVAAKLDEIYGNPGSMALAKTASEGTSQTSQNPLEMFAAFANAMRPNERVRVAERLFLTIDEAADYSGLPQSHIRQLLKAGKLGMKTGGGWRIRRADLEKL